MIRFLWPFRLLNRTGENVSSMVRPISTATFPLQFKSTPALWAEPLKKKKKLDPAIIKAREEKKKKKIEKEIRKLQKLGKQLKPIEEAEIPLPLVEGLQHRKRNIEVSEETHFERKHLLKKWSQFKNKNMKKDTKLLETLIEAQQEALDELRLESEELYQAAVKIDPGLLPFKFNGPVETPSNEEYLLPDGDFINTSKKWI